jgi:5-methylcytosine-specific restriction protein A
VRQEFSKPTRRLALERSEGRCEGVGILYGLKAGLRCNAPLNRGKIFDHVTADALGGEPTLENCLVICPTCNAVKTHKGDTPRVAKMKRQRDKADGIKTRRGRSFQTNRDAPWRKRMDGTVERREP